MKFLFSLKEIKLGCIQPKNLIANYSHCPREKHNKKVKQFCIDTKVHQRPLKRLGTGGWVQPRLNHGFSWVLKLIQLNWWVLELTLSSLTGIVRTNKIPAQFPGFLVKATEPNKQVLQVSWVLEFSLPNLTGLLKQIKSQVLVEFAGFSVKATEPIELDSLGFRIEVAQFSWVH